MDNVEGMQDQTDIGYNARGRIYWHAWSLDYVARTSRRLDRAEFVSFRSISNTRASWHGNHVATCGSCPQLPCASHFLGWRLGQRHAYAAWFGRLAVRSHSDTVRNSRYKRLWGDANLTMQVRRSGYYGLFRRTQSSHHNWPSWRSFSVSKSCAYYAALSLPLSTSLLSISVNQAIQASPTSVVLSRSRHMLDLYQFRDVAKPARWLLHPPSSWQALQARVASLTAKIQPIDILSSSG